MLIGMMVKFRIGLKLLSRVKPTEIFFKSIPKELKCVEITYPWSLNPRLVRRRLRHIAFRGSVVHSQYFYGSAMLLPLTSVLTFLPLPNIPFFWILFRTYSHRRAAKGSEKLLHLVTDDCTCPNQHLETKMRESTASNSDKGSDDSVGPTWSRFLLRPRNLMMLFTAMMPMVLVNVVSKNLREIQFEYNGCY